MYFIKTLHTYESFWNSIIQHIVNLTFIAMQYFAIPRQKPNSCIVSLFFTLFKLNTYYWLLFFSLLATWPGLAVTVTGPNCYCNTKARTAGCQQAGDQVGGPSFGNWKGDQTWRITRVNRSEGHCTSRHDRDASCT